MPTYLGGHLFPATHLQGRPRQSAYLAFASEKNLKNLTPLNFNFQLSTKISADAHQPQHVKNLLVGRFQNLVGMRVPSASE